MDARVEELGLLLGEERRGRLLDQLLVPALQRAVAGRDDDHVAVRVGQALGLDVRGLVEIALDEALAAPEGLRRPRAPRTSNSSSISSSVRATFSPRPPPPNAALIAIGSPCSCANAMTSSAPSTGSAVPGTSGAPTFWAMCRACTLSPRELMAAGGGPIQTSPASITAWAKSAFSARKP